MKLQALLPLSAEMPSQSEEKVESDDGLETAASGRASGGAADAAGDSTMQQQQEDDDGDVKDASLAAGENADGGGDGAGGDGTPATGVGGKKKGVRKKRSLNWEEAERGLLVEIIKSKVDFVENRCVDAKSIKTKRLSWMQITKQFNALNFRQRSLEQIQVQWRAMKNAAKREFTSKHPKDTLLDGLRMVEYMEEMHKEPIIGRSHTRGNAGHQHAAAEVAVHIKKELSDLDDDDDLDDTPLASLPTSTNNSDDTLQTSTIAIPSPPPSGDSQNEAPILSATLAAGKAKKQTNKSKGKVTSLKKQRSNAAAADATELTVAAEVAGEDLRNVAIATKKMKRQRSQDTLSSDDQHHQTAAATSDVAVTRSHTISSPHTAMPSSIQATATNTTSSNFTLPPPPSHPADDKFKKHLYELIKRSRLTEIDYVRREHEQKMRFAQMEQELKLTYYRQEMELKLQQQREEFAIRMRQQEAEHEARMRVYQQKTSIGSGRLPDANGTQSKSLTATQLDSNERKTPLQHLQEQLQKQEQAQEHYE